MTHRPYPAYKDSGIEWLGEVPEQWEVKRLGRLFRERIEEGNDELPILSVSIHDGVSDKELDDKELDRKVTRSDDKSKYKRVLPGDLVYNMMRAWQGGFGTVAVEGQVSPAYVVACPIEKFVTSHIERVLRTPNAVEEMKRHSQGVTDFRLRLYWDEFKTIQMPLPPLSEQKAIAYLLDRETSKIDELVAEQLRLMELLSEKRQAVISQAVTRGLDYSVLLKDSGVEWLGQIPAHWEVAPIKRLFKVLDGKRIPLSSEERSTRRGEYPYYGASGIIDWIDDFIFDDELVLVSEDGANLLNRSTAIAFVASGKYWVNNHAHILQPIDTCTRFWAECIESVDLTPFVTGSAQPKLTIEALTNIRIAAPTDLTEREKIQDFIITETARFDALKAEARRGIQLLKERRTALISAAVTGKIDVREAV